MDVQLRAYNNEMETATRLIIQFWQAHNHFTPSFEDAQSDLKDWTKAGHKLYFIVLNNITARETFMPPAVLPEQAPINISITRIHFESSGHASKFVVAKPAVVIMVAT